MWHDSGLSSMEAELGTNKVHEPEGDDLQLWGMTNATSLAHRLRTTPVLAGRGDEPTATGEQGILQLHAWCPSSWQCRQQATLGQTIAM
jgi:hypothetical protein